MKLASIITAFALFAIACTSTTTTTTPAPTTEKSPTDKADSGTPSEKGPSDPDKKKEEEEEETSTCADEATQQACAQCCAGEHQQGATVYIQALTQCLCEADNCATECEATVCGATPKNPDTACNQCASQKQQNCGQALSQACSANQDCVAFSQCAQQSCAGKP